MTIRTKVESWLVSSTLSYDGVDNILYWATEDDYIVVNLWGDTVRTKISHQTSDTTYLETDAWEIITDENSDPLLIDTWTFTTTTWTKV